MELPETDKAVEAREARRRRLLEKSNARLGLITGREHNEGKMEFRYANVSAKLSLTFSSDS